MTKRRVFKPGAFVFKQGTFGRVISQQQYDILVQPILNWDLFYSDWASPSAPSISMYDDHALQRVSSREGQALLAERKAALKKRKLSWK